MNFTEAVETIGKSIDLAGIAALVVGITIATLALVRNVLRKTESANAYRAYRTGIGRAILLGLELLVAADIIRTVAVSPTFESVGVLAIIVLIRTFLSMALEVELEGRWPWDPRKAVLGSNRDSE